MRASRFTLLVLLGLAGCSRCGNSTPPAEMPQDVRRRVEATLPVDFRPFTRAGDYQPMQFVDETDARGWEHGHIALERRARTGRPLAEVRARFERALEHALWTKDVATAWTHPPSDYGANDAEWTAGDLLVTRHRDADVMRMRVWFAEDASRIVVSYEILHGTPSAK